ncbi:hypothetical protein [Kitasatospora sp. MBT66]|uniref:hypothetical protein n=1 Tax=Kitasatospora sp. MBT66 TaxID=1444769 RepID=UPI0005B98A0C|nr:hypothetical protein [Kitasatospora sp. MBT66]
MTRATRYAIPAVLLAFLLVPLGLIALRDVLAEPPPPSPVGRWIGQGADGSRLELVEGGRLGPSVVPAAACLEPAAAMGADKWLEVADGTWEASYDPDSGDLVTIRFGTPRRCYLMLTNSVTEGEGHRLTMGLRPDHRTKWTLIRP